jgi:oligoribonuclease (3'-5' exoribonuclease)
MKEKRQQRSARALTELNNRPPFITAVPVGRIIPKENDFVFHFKSDTASSINKRQQQKQKRKSLHRPPFILSTRRPSIVNIDSVPRLLLSSRKKNYTRSTTKSRSNNASAMKIEKVPKVAKKNILTHFDNASISQMLKNKIEADKLILLKEAPKVESHELTFNMNFNSAIATSTVQKDVSNRMSMVEQAARAETGKRQSKNTTLEFLEGFSPIETNSPVRATLNETFTEDPLAGAERKYKFEKLKQISFYFAKIRLFFIKKIKISFIF